MGSKVIVDLVGDLGLLRAKGLLVLGDLGVTGGEGLMSILGGSSMVTEHKNQLQYNEKIDRKTTIMTLVCEAHFY